MTTTPSFHPLELTAADYSFPMMYAGCCIFFRLQNPNEGVRPLQIAVTKLITQLPYLTGIVTPSAEKKGVIEIHPPSPHALFTSTTSSSQTPLCITKHLPHFRLPSRPRHCGQRKNEEEYSRNACLALAPTHVAATALDSSHQHPVIRFQINVLADGILLTLFANHLVIDGPGFGILVEKLASFCRDDTPLPTPTPTPEFGMDSDMDMMRRDMAARAFLATIGQPGTTTKLQERQDTAVEVTMPESVSPSASLPAPNTNTNTADTGDLELKHIASLHDCIFQLSSSKLEYLRQAAIQHWNKQQGGGLGSSTDPPVSTDDVITACLCVCFSRLRNSQCSAAAAPCTLQRMVDIRRRLNQPSSLDSYIGNCFVILSQTLDAGPSPMSNLGETSKSKSQSLPSIASTISSIACTLRKKVNGVDEEYIRADMAAAADISPPTNNDNGNDTADLCVASHRRLSFFSQDFGSVLDRVCTIAPPRTVGNGGGSDGSWEVCVTLDREAMGELMRDEVFGWLVERGEYLCFYEEDDVQAKL
ncbi:hypothetical protein BJX70DRAFT_387188 [Aspergillus crustosus]